MEFCLKDHIQYIGCELIKDVEGMRDMCVGSVMSKSECDDIVTFYVVH